MSGSVRLPRRRATSMGARMRGWEKSCCAGAGQPAHGAAGAGPGGLGPSGSHALQPVRPTSAARIRLARRGRSNPDRNVASWRTARRDRPQARHQQALGRRQGAAPESAGTAGRPRKPGIAQSARPAPQASPCRQTCLQPAFVSDGASVFPRPRLLLPDVGPRPEFSLLRGAGSAWEALLRSPLQARLYPEIRPPPSGGRGCRRSVGARAPSFRRLISPNRKPRSP